MGVWRDVTTFYTYPDTTPDSERTTPLKIAFMIFLMLWAVQTRENSPLVFSCPLTLNPRNPLITLRRG
jgi:hypothetical protein